MDDDLRLAPVGASAKQVSPQGTRPAAPGSPHGENWPPRRGFFMQFVTLVLGAVVGLVPLAVGALTIIFPLRKRAAAEGLVRVGTLGSVPLDGTPQVFPVIVDKRDAWNTYPQQPIGSVYIRRLGPEGTDPPRLQVFQTTCPHAGCFVGFVRDRKQFYCPCHTSSFTLDGARVPPCPSPRDLDPLEYELRGTGEEAEILIKFVDFYTGLEERKPKS